MARHMRRYSKSHACLEGHASLPACFDPVNGFGAMSIARCPATVSHAPSCAGAKFVPPDARLAPLRTTPAHYIDWNFT